MYAMSCHATSSESTEPKKNTKILQDRMKERKDKNYVYDDDDDDAVSSHPRKLPTPSPPGQRPRHAHDHLAFAETPEIHAHADDVVQPRVRALVQQQRCQAAQRVDEQSGFDAAVHGR